MSLIVSFAVLTKTEEWKNQKEKSKGFLEVHYKLPTFVKKTGERLK